MKLDIQTLAFILSLTCVTQVVAIFFQYKVNKTYRGIEWWLLGSTLMALGFIFLSLGPVKIIGIIGVIGNPLLISGRICLFVGTMRFVGKKENSWMTILALIGFIALYYYYLFGNSNVSGRTVVVSTAIAAFSWLTAYNLFFNSNKSFSGSAHFTGTVFFVHGCYLVVVVFYTLFSQPIHSYINFSPLQLTAFITPTITSTLWTFGFILMVNQRLNSENLEEKGNLQQVFNTSPDASLITRWADGHFIDVNLGFSDISGYTRAEMIGKSDIEINIWNNAADLENFLAELKDKEFCKNMEFVFQRKDGSRFLGMISAQIITIYGLPHVVSVIRDITERKSAEEALRESEETYRSILKASPDDITITDLEGRILMVSPAATAMFGYEQGAGDGLRIQDFIVPEDMDRAQSNLKRMYQGGHPGPNEYRGIRRDGTLFDIEVNSGFVRGLNGQPTKMVFIVRDITERKQVEAEKAKLEAQNRQLQKAESLGRMAGAIAHHFNNKLQSVMANLELVEGQQEGLDSAKHLARAKQATQGAAAISRLMLVYLGQASDKREPQVLSNLCSEAQTSIQGTLPDHITLETDWPFPGPVVNANADQFQQVLTNLVANAWESMGEANGPIRIGLRTCSATDIPSAHRFPIDWQPLGLEHACLEVADSGSGIAESDIEKLFDPFFSTKFSGRGLGLPVVLGIVQAHGGAVTVESRLGQGSVFRVYLPVTTAAVPHPSERMVQTPEPAGGGTILLVDDDEFLLMATGALLERMGFTLLTAKDGLEAVEVFQRHGNDIRCVITDLTMPRMDGWETLTALRQLAPTLPVILSSGYDKAQVMSGPHPDFPQGFLSKPYSLQQLRDALGCALVVAERHEQ